MDTSHFSHNQNIIDSAEPLDVGGATCECFKVKLYGKQHFLKRLKPELRTDPRYVAALHKEFETGYNLDHPHLVRYTACGDDYLLTEFIDGMTLSEFAETNPTFFKNKANVDNLLSSLLDVLDYLHSHQIVHLDLKPDNILITRVGNELKLTDLGFCYTDTFTDTMGRTDTFAAPEQLNDGMVDHRTDIYALGRIIATLPCAKRYKKVIERCTKPNRKDRYQSATELQKDFTKNRNKWFLLALVVAACLAAISVWWLNNRYSTTSSNLEPITTNVPSQNSDTTSTITNVSSAQDEINFASVNSDATGNTKSETTTNVSPNTTIDETENLKSQPTNTDIDPTNYDDELRKIIAAFYNKHLKNYEDSSYSSIDQKLFSDKCYIFYNDCHSYFNKKVDKRIYDYQELNNLILQFDYQAVDKMRENDKKACK